MTEEKSPRRQASLEELRAEIHSKLQGLTVDELEDLEKFIEESLDSDASTPISN